MPMSPEVKKSVIFNAIGSGLGWACFGVGISAVTSNFWIRVDGTTRMGLWNQCDINNLCTSIQVEPWLNAVRAFTIMFVIFAFLGCLANIASQCKYDKSARSGSGGIFSIAATFGVVGASVYTATIGQRYAADRFFYGYGFAAMWGVIGGAYIAGVLQQISGYYMPEFCEDGGKCGSKNVDEEKF